MIEVWKDIRGYEGRYQISNLGRIKSLPFMQRYLLRNGAEAYRRTKEKPLATQFINSAYLIVHLCLDYRRTAYLVHVLVADHFDVPGTGPTVNHKNGVKSDNCASNLEWATYREQHLHAVELGLNKQAVRVKFEDIFGNTESFGSLAQAAARFSVGIRTVQTAARSGALFKNTWQVSFA